MTNYHVSVLYDTKIGIGYPNNGAQFDKAYSRGEHSMHSSNCCNINMVSSICRSVICCRTSRYFGPASVSIPMRYKVKP